MVANDLEFVLAQFGVCETDIETNPRITETIKDTMESAIRHDITEDYQDRYFIGDITQIHVYETRNSTTYMYVDIVLAMYCIRLDTLTFDSNKHYNI